VWRGLDQIEPETDRQVLEHRLTTAQRHRTGHQAVHIHEVRPGESLGEREAAVDDDVAAVLGLEARDPLGEGPAREPRRGAAGATSSARSPLAIVDVGQSARVRVRENTTFGISFIGAAYSPVEVGQNPDICSYVTRPIA